MDEHHVDIYGDPSIRFRAGPVLELAERHGVRGTVELLLPYTVSGPGYVRGVLDSLRTALRVLKGDRIDEGIHWLGEAVRCVPARSRTLHRPREPHDPAATADRAIPNRSDSADTPGPGHGRAPVRHTPSLRCSSGLSRSTCTRRRWPASWPGQPPLPRIPGPSRAPSSDLFTRWDHPGTATDRRRRRAVITPCRQHPAAGSGSGRPLTSTHTHASTVSPTWPAASDGWRRPPERRP